MEEKRGWRRRGDGERKMEVKQNEEGKKKRRESKGEEMREEG